MEVIFRLQGAEFVWDEHKARINVGKHGITFEEAAEAFFDPFYQAGDASVQEERRDFVIGYSALQNLLLVVHVVRGDRIRIISARQATRAEKKLYEAA